LDICQEQIEESIVELMRVKDLGLCVWREIAGDAPPL